MSEWVIAVIAAGSALAGSVITGWFTRSAGARQASATRHAGDRQAEAMVETVRMTFDEQRAMRVLDQRRQTYVRFLDAAETVMATRRTGGEGRDDRPALQRALALVTLEGPDDVARTARELFDQLRQDRPLDDLRQAQSKFIDACRAALGYQDAAST